MSPTLPKTYKAAVFKAKGEPLVIEDIELKEPIAGEILIKVLACGVCRSDEDVQQGIFGDVYPRIPGHEMIGNVVAVGPGEKVWKIGQKVGGPWAGGHDGTCKSCQRGRQQMCANPAVNGVTRDGGYAEYCHLRSEAVVKIPEDADPVSYAPLLCAGVTVFNSMRHMGCIPGDTVAIQGLGGLGHLAIQYASKSGFRTVALSSSGAKEAFAKDLGAHHYIDGSKEDHAEALQKMGGADLIVATAPDPPIIGKLLTGLAPGGKLLILAALEVTGDVTISPGVMIGKALSVHAWPSGAALDCEEAIAFAEVHNVNCMVEKFPLVEAAKAFDHMNSGKARFRAVLVMD